MANAELARFFHFGKCEIAEFETLERCSDARRLAGHAGPGTRVQEIGLTCQQGRITKAGRKDLRSAVAEAANHGRKSLSA